ncbi:hypothetical protein ACLMJK_002605 [Lecanora helva]
MASLSAQEQIAKILEMDKEAHWLENKNLPPDEIQRRWAMKSAPLTAILGADAPTHRVDLSTNRDTSAPEQNTQSTLPKSPLPGMAHDRRRVSSGDALQPASKADPASQPMAKKRSSQSIHGPFVDTQTLVPPLTLNTWQVNHEEPFSCFSSPSTSSSPPAFKTRRTAAGCLPTRSSDYSSMSVYDPAEYVKQSQSTLSPTSPQFQRPRRNSSQNLSPSSCLSQSPATPTSDGLTNATTLSSVGMSRGDSLGGSSMYGSMAMLRVDSQRSESRAKSDATMEELLYPIDSTSNLKDVAAPTTHTSLSLDHAGAVSENASITSVPRGSDNLKLPLVVEEDFAMSRTTSCESTDSSKSRLARRRQEQATLSTRPIAPKNASGSMSRHSSSSSSSESDMVRQLSADGSKVAIQKAKYQRPTHEKIKCTRCNLKPDGYRGPHELRRHIDNKHGATRKVWICVDKSPDQNFLSNCKQCREKKTYGAYYNAACHLRRIHWNPREKGKKADKSGKARGGNGGGDYPPMDTLKLWMEEVCVSATSDSILVDDDDQTDAPEDCAIDASRESNDCSGYDEVSAQPDLLIPAYDKTSINHESIQTSVDLAQTCGNGFEQADFSEPDTFNNTLLPSLDGTFNEVPFPLMFNDDNDSTANPPTSSQSPTYVHARNDKERHPHLVSGNIESAKIPLTSSMNDHVSHLNQLNSFPLDSDFMEFPL